MMSGSIEFTIIECFKCHCQFAMTKEMNNYYLNAGRGKGFYCPRGHEQAYLGKSKAQKLQEKLNRVTRSMDYHVNSAAALHDEVKHKEAQIRGHKSAYSKLKNRIAQNETD